jgi:hypothetical protein
MPPLAAQGDAEVLVGIVPFWIDVNGGPAELLCLRVPANLVVAKAEVVMDHLVATAGEAMGPAAQNPVRRST